MTVNSQDDQESEKPRRGYGFIGPILIVMVIALFISLAAFLVNLSATVSQGPFAYQEAESWVSLSVIGLGLIVAVMLFYGILEHSITVSVRLAVALFVFSAVGSSLIYLQLLMTTYDVASPALHFILTFVAYLGSFLGVLAIFDVLPRRARNVLFAVCSGVLGAFIGSLIPTITMVLILSIMAGIDLILTRRSTVEKSTKVNEDYEMLVLLRMSYAGKTWAVGIADLVCYSFLVANTLVYIGLIPAVISAAFIVVGSLVTAARARESTRSSGLPLSVVLGLIPVVAFSFFPLAI